jgi:hypothetical protein
MNETQRTAAWALSKDGQPYKLMYERDERGACYSWAPLYDQAAIDAAIATERKRCAQLVEPSWSRPAGSCCSVRAWDELTKAANAIRAGR